MFISRGMVKAQLEHTFTKLEMPKRGELAAKSPAGGYRESSPAADLLCRMADVTRAAESHDQSAGTRRTSADTD
jgi:hypothetical protein